jgi:flagellar M-ring protein FliF
VKRSPQELQQIQTLAQNAIGIDTARGDAMTVQNLSFTSAAADDLAPASFFEQARKGLSDYSSAIRYAMLAVLFGAAYVLMIRPLQKKVLEQVIVVPPEPTALAEVEPLPALPTVTAASTTRVLREQLGQQVSAEPAKSARLLQAWLREEVK